MKKEHGENMVTKEYFMDKELPEKLSKEETESLFKQFYDGSKEAREKIIIHNLRLVFYEVNSRFLMVNYEKMDLLSCGMIGLMNAVDNYDLSKGFAFNTYAIKCIDNEILRFLKSMKGQNNIDSLDRVLFKAAHDHELKLVDQIQTRENEFERIENKEVNKIIQDFVKQLPEREREIIKLRFGFYDDKIYTLESIAKIMHLSRFGIWKITNKVLVDLKVQLERTGAIEKQKSTIRKRKYGVSEITTQTTATPEEIVFYAKQQLAKLEITKEEFLKILEYVKFTKNKYLIAGLNAEDATCKILTFPESSKKFLRKKIQKYEK